MRPPPVGAGSVADAGMGARMRRPAVGTENVADVGTENVAAIGAEVLRAR